jgi:hypothetical protein
MYKPWSSEEVLHTRTLKKKTKKKGKNGKRGKSIIKPNLKARKEGQFSDDVE